MKLNLGCGFRKIDGYVNIDQELSTRPDLFWNLEQVAWPFDGNSAEEILATHVLEHIGQITSTFLNIMKEMHRILRPGGILEIKTPHHHSDSYWGDPTHVRPITGPMLELFSKENCKMFVEKQWPNTPLATYLDINLEMRRTELTLTPYWANKWQNKTISKQELDHATATLWNVVDEITFTMVKVE
jgi:SAM-dependent methyltransferase